MIESYKPIMKGLLKMLVFDAKMQPSEFENMPIRKLLVYAKIYAEYVNEVNESTKNNGKTD
jgi:hypothetical protein